MRCPYCGSKLEALDSRIEDKYAGGCGNKSCPVIFRTKELYSKEDAIGMIEDIIKFSKTGGDSG